MRKLLTIGITTALLASLAGGALAAPAGYEAVEVTDGATIKGRVTLNGDIPAAATLEVTKDHEACGKEAKPSEALEVNAENKGVKNAVVYIKKIKEGKAWPDGSGELTYDQKECVFIGHVVIMPVDATVTFTNSDSVLHNVKAASLKTSFNESIPADGKLVQQFSYKEQVKIECSVHPWMTAWFFVSENPYAVATDENGNFELTDIPAGKYTIEVWHESLKKGKEKIKLKDGEALDLNFELDQG